MKSIQGFNDILHHYDVFIFDLWGVVHNGVKPFPHMMDLFETLKRNDKCVALLSNAPRDVDNIQNHLKTLGIEPVKHFDVLYTSGQQCLDQLMDQSTPFHKNLGSKYFHPGPVRDLKSYENIPYERVDALKDADFKLLTGLLENEMDKPIEYYYPDLELMLSRNMPLICANADKRVVWGDSHVLCIGAIAEHYKKMGGPVMVHGKPCESVFSDLQQRIESFLGYGIDKSKMIMTGDSLGTDILGANAYGIDSVLVQTGVHGNDIRQHGIGYLDDLAKEYNANPTFFCESAKP